MAEERNTSTEIPEFDFDFTEDIVSDEVQVNIPSEDPPTESIVEESSTKEDKSDENVSIPEPPSPQENEVDEIPEDADPMAYGIYKTMVERGYWEESKEFKGTLDEVDSMFENLPDAIFGGVMNSMAEPLKKLLEYGYSKGEELKQEDLVNFFNTHNTVNIDEADISTAEGQRSYLKNSLVKSGQDPAEADDLIDLWEDKGKLKDRADARFASDKVAKEEAVNAEIEAAKIAKANKAKAQKTFVNDIKTNVKETGWKSKTQQAVLAEVFDGNLNRKSKIISNHPKALIQLANYLRYFDENKGEIDESAYKAQAFSSSASDVKNALEKNFSSIPQSKARQTTDKNKNTTKNEFEFAD